MIYNESFVTHTMMRRNRCYDCIITDPPYRNISGGKGTPGNGSPSGMLTENDGRIFDHNDITPEQYAPILFRLVTDPGHLWIFCNEMNRRRMEDAMLAAGFKTHFLGAWIKSNKVVNRWGMKNGELLFLFRKGAARGLYTPSLEQFICCPSVPPSGKMHPTQKPVNLMRKLVDASSLPGETVFDPFMGAGSTGVAAVQAGRRFEGCEIDPQYFETAQYRIARAHL